MQIGCKFPHLLADGILRLRVGERLLGSVHRRSTFHHRSRRTLRSWSGGCGAA